MLIGKEIRSLSSWARKVVTTYGYDRGLLETVTYTNDPANTPGVIYDYDVFGRVRTVTQGSGSTVNVHTYAYKDDRRCSLLSSCLIGAGFPGLSRGGIRICYCLQAFGKCISGFH